ncbi:MAG: DUF4270 family protein [Oscillospiraceae bacterium]|nr:DUF4270 family protein [Oscillospiraceae bacterium]
MEIRTLRYFLAVAREENMSRAAEQLHVTQPTLSKALKALEDELGKKLFTRHSFSIALTDEGALLRSRAEDLVSMADKIEQEFMSLDDVTGGDIYFGLAESYQIRYLAREVRAFKKLCPGFYSQTVDGLGMMAEVQMTQLRLFYKHQHDTVTIADVKEFTGTEEVLQTTHFTNDRENIKRLAAIDTCTYIKAPDGIYTEVTLPVEEIKKGHENDTIMSAKIVLRKMNEISEFSEYLLMEPENLLMVMKDSLHTFFEERNLPNNITSYLATYNSSKNSYTFNNISGMINHMYNKANRSEGWNKVVLIPVQVTKTSASSSTATGSVASVNNELRVTSIRLVGGSRNRHEAVRMSVVYNKNE